MRGKVLAGIGAAIAATALASGAPAFGAATISPNTNLVNNQTVTITYSGYNAFDTVFINQCWRAQDDPQFDPISSCSPVNSINPSANASGGGTTPFNVWAGLDQNIGEVSCGVHDPNELEFFPTCYIRLSPGGLLDTSRDETFPITFATGGDPVIPEAPFTVLLPLGALAVLGGAYFVARNRKTAAA